MKRWMKSAAMLVAAAVSGVAMGQGHSAAPAPVKDGAKADIVDTAVAAGSFKTLAAALKAAGLVDTLKGKGPFTVFAPTDEAFAKLPVGVVEDLLKPENKAKLTAILTYHVVAGNDKAEQVVKLKGVPTVNGQRVSIGVDGASVTLDGKAKVTKTDIACTNGTIHVIDTVLLPASKNVLEVAGEAGSFSTLAAAIKAAGLEDALKGSGPFTVFAPTDAAFAKLPPATLADLLKPENKEKLAAILKFHVIAGRAFSEQVVGMKESEKTLEGQAFQISMKDGKVMIGNSKGMATVTATDVQASNGVIHVIDSVILPK